ncbi:MAG: DUF6851 domain-containing protein [Aurantibacter sp.]
MRSRLEKQLLLVLMLWLPLNPSILGQSNPNQSVARQWNDALLNAIRNDFARPTIHARNLFHAAIAMYDSWAAFDAEAGTFLLGKNVRGFICAFDGLPLPEDIEAAREEAMSYALYRLLKYRFRDAPGKNQSLPVFDQLMEDLGYDTSFTSDDYSNGSPAALGNYLAQALIDFGLQDGSNEAEEYENQFYKPINEPLIPTEPGTRNLTNPNRWQPLFFITAEDQAGFEIDRTPPFLSPEWGKVVPFALRGRDLTIYSRGGDDYWVYHDPGEPVYLQGGENDDDYQWGHSLVAVWSSHLDPTDGVMWDISPASIGNIANYPPTVEGLRDFYHRYQGGDISRGHTVNPKTGQPYPPQMVPRGDYARVLAEFWADGPDSETPPGHWFTILNTVNDHPDLVKKFKGEGEVLNDLEWDVKAYFTLAGAMQDAAVTAWGIKGWYDYVRPITAIRYIAEQGQSTDPESANFVPTGIPLEEGLIEVVVTGDLLAGENDENVGKIKLYNWRGPDAIEDVATDFAGVGWILAENWLPYQRPTFVTPPFAGYVSGHSTFSRAAAEVLTLLPGDEYFPGGVGEFVAKKNDFLVFEDGPSVDVVLQWATYRDASDQTSLSRIWGGIHPPIDDIPGRLIGIKVGQDAFALAERYFQGEVITSLDDHQTQQEDPIIYPNPVNEGVIKVHWQGTAAQPVRMKLHNLQGKLLLKWSYHPGDIYNLDVSQLTAGTYILLITDNNNQIRRKIMVR